MKTNFGSEYLL